MQNAGKYKWLFQGKGLQIQINNKIITVLNSVLIEYEKLLRPGFVLSASAFGLGR